MNLQSYNFLDSTLFMNEVVFSAFTITRLKWVFWALIYVQIIIKHPQLRKFKFLCYKTWGSICYRINGERMNLDKCNNNQEMICRIGRRWWYLVSSHITAGAKKNAMVRQQQRMERRSMYVLVVCCQPYKEFVHSASTSMKNVATTTC